VLHPGGSRFLPVLSSGSRESRAAAEAQRRVYGRHIPESGKNQRMMIKIGAKEKGGEDNESLGVEILSGRH